MSEMEEIPGCSFKSHPDLDAVAGLSGAASESRGKILRRVTESLIKGLNGSYACKGEAHCKILCTVKLQFTGKMQIIKVSFRKGGFCCTGVKNQIVFRTHFKVS